MKILSTETMQLLMVISVYLAELIIYFIENWSTAKNEGSIPLEKFILHKLPFYPFKNFNLYSKFGKTLFIFGYFAFLIFLLYGFIMGIFLEYLLIKLLYKANSKSVKTTEQKYKITENATCEDVDPYMVNSSLFNNDDKDSNILDKEKPRSEYQSYNICCRPIEISKEESSLSIGSYEIYLTLIKRGFITTSYIPILKQLKASDSLTNEQFNDLLSKIQNSTATS